MAVLEYEQTVTFQEHAARCEVCGALHWVRSGWAIYWATGEPKGWASYDPVAGVCLRGCLVSERAGYRPGCPALIEPVGWTEQQALQSIYRLGGHVAVAEVVNAELPELLRRCP